MDIAVQQLSNRQVGGVSLRIHSSFDFCVGMWENVPDRAGLTGYDYSMSRSQEETMSKAKPTLKEMKAELKRLNAVIDANGGPTKLVPTISKKKHHVKGYIYVEPSFDDPDFEAMFLQGPKRLSWGAEGKGHPRWRKDLGLYSCLKSALDGI
jgi:hypothetical protein